MFGEHESESPRVPSPWDPFLPSPPNEISSEVANQPQSGIPRLVPEAEEGNVEYKLKLTNVTPARFARLVTQLKWRLLEGGGQAYYELGVADSGALVGLPRIDLEQSLETLEMMAGEIGASVIVVKEIEVPPIVIALADEVRGYIDPDTGEWAQKMIRQVMGVSTSEEDSTPTHTEGESTTDLTDYDDGPTPSYALASDRPIIYTSQPLLRSDPSLPTAQSSPFIAPIADDLALFSMEPESSDRVDADDERDPEDIPRFSIDLEIASVYKPRPFRKRVPPTPGAAHGRRTHKTTEKKPQSWRNDTVRASAPADASKEDITNGRDVKADQRRLARDRKREEKRKALIAFASTPAQESLDASVDPFVSQNVRPAAEDLPVVEQTDEAAELVSGLEALHVGVEMQNVVPGVNLGELAVPTESISKDRGPRLIVEALVVRKLSLEEAFLDFGGFQLV